MPVHHSQSTPKAIVDLPKVFFPGEGVFGGELDDRDILVFCLVGTVEICSQEILKLCRDFLDLPIVTQMSQSQGTGYKHDGVTRPVLSTFVFRWTQSFGTLGHHPAAN
jgi:hypothetical protein